MVASISIANGSASANEDVRAKKKKASQVTLPDDDDANDEDGSGNYAAGQQYSNGSRTNKGSDPSEAASPQLRCNETLGAEEEEDEEEGEEDEEEEEEPGEGSERERSKIRKADQKLDQDLLSLASSISSTDEFCRGILDLEASSGSQLTTPKAQTGSNYSGSQTIPSLAKKGPRGGRKN